MGNSIEYVKLGRRCRERWKPEGLLKERWKREMRIERGGRVSCTASLFDLEAKLVTAMPLHYGAY